MFETSFRISFDVSVTFYYFIPQAHACVELLYRSFGEDDNKEDTTPKEETEEDHAC